MLYNKHVRRNIKNQIKIKYKNAEMSSNTGHAFFRVPLFKFCTPGYTKFNVIIQYNVLNSDGKGFSNRHLNVK